MIYIIRSDGYRDDAHKRRNERIIEAFEAYTKKHCLELAEVIAMRENQLIEGSND